MTFETLFAHHTTTQVCPLLRPFPGADTLRFPHSQGDTVPRSCPAWADGGQPAALGSECRQRAAMRMGREARLGGTPAV